MRDDHIEQVISVIKGTLGHPSSQRELVLRKNLRDLKLKSGPAGYIKERRDPVALWIANARKWATNKCLMGAKVDIDMVVSSNPLPEGVDIRAIRIIIKHPDFKRVGTVRTKKPNGGYRTSGQFMLSSQTQTPDAITDW